MIAKWFRRTIGLGVSKNVQINQLWLSCQRKRRVIDDLRESDATLRSQLRDANSEIERISKMLADPKFLSMEVENGAINLVVEHWAAKIMAQSFSDSLGDAGNWASLEIGPMPSDKGMLLVTIKKVSGQSPEALVGVLRKEIESLNQNKALDAELIMSLNSKIHCEDELRREIATLKRQLTEAAIPF